MTPGGPGHLHTRLRPAPPPGPGPASRGGAPLALPGAAGHGVGGIVRARPRFAGRRIRRRDAGSLGERPGAALSLFIHPAVSMAPPPSSAPSLSRARQPARARPGGGRGGRVRRGAPPERGPRVVSKPRGARRRTPSLTRSPLPQQLCHFSSPGPPPTPRRARQHPRSVPHRARRRGPRAQRSPRPGRAARGRGAAQAKLLSCFARSEVAAETAASRPLPGLGGSEHTPTRHHPLPALAPAAPARTRQHPLPAPAKSPGFQRSRSGGGCTPPPRSARGWGAGAGGRLPPTQSPRGRGAFALCKAERPGRRRPPAPASSSTRAGLAERARGSVRIPSRSGLRRGQRKGLRWGAEVANRCSRAHVTREGPRGGSRGWGRGRAPSGSPAEPDAGCTPPAAA